MDDLAREKYSLAVDLMVKHELKEANIPVVKEGNIRNAEVKTRYIGVLNGFVFQRFKDYWSVTGHMSVMNAKVLFATYGSLGIRAGGRVGDGNPEYAWVCDGSLLDKELTELRKRSSNVKEYMKLIANEIMENPDAFRYVKVHYVESLLGLYYFSEFIRKRDIHSESMEKLRW